MSERKRGTKAEPQADANDESQEPQKAAGRPDETVAGGRYRVGGTLVDANGHPVKD